MSTLIHKMHIGIGANAAGLEGGLKTAAARMRNFADRTEKTMTRVTTSIFFAREAFNTLRSVVQSLPLDTMDATGKFAQRIGMSTQSLTEMQHAAGLAGATASDLENSLKDMTLRLGQAAVGSGTAGKSLASLGLSIETMMSLSPDKQLRLIADAIKDVESPMDRARIASELFGESGTKLLTMLEGGSETLDAAAEDARNLGLAFDDVDHARIAMANDALSRMQGVFTGLMQTLAIELAPLITATADALTEMFVDLRKDLTTTSDAADGLVTILGGIEDVVNSIKIAFNAVRWFFMKVLQGVIYFFQLMDKGYRAVMKLIGRPVKTPSFIQQFADEWQEEIDKVGGSIKDTFDDIVDQPIANAVKDKLDDVKKAAEDSAAGIRTAGEGVGKDLVDGISDGIEKQASDIEVFIASLRDQIGSMTMGAERFRLQAMIESGADADLVEQAERLLLEIDTRKAEDELKKFGESVAESVRTPAEMLADQSTKLQRAFDEGFLSDEQYRRALERAREKFAPTQEEMAQEVAAEVRRGSVDMLDVGTVLGLMIDPPGIDRQDDEAEQITKRQDEQTKVLQGVERNTKLQSVARFN